MSKFKVQYNGQEAELEVTRQGDKIRVVRDGVESVMVLVHSDEQGHILEVSQTDGTRRRLHVAGHIEGDKRQLWVNGRLLTYERVRERRSGSTAGDSSLAATIPAVVAQLLVQTGDTVSEGDKLILLESMKMVIPIQAPYDGVVTAIHCRPGESVQAGIPLVAVARNE